MKGNNARLLTTNTAVKTPATITAYPLSCTHSNKYKPKAKLIALFPTHCAISSSDVPPV